MKKNKKGILDFIPTDPGDSVLDFGINVSYEEYEKRMDLIFRFIPTSIKENNGKD